MTTTAQEIVHAEDVSKQKQVEKEYHVSTAFSELNISKFLLLSSAVYMGENLIYYPFDVVRTRLQVQREASFSLGRALKMTRELGWKGLYSGYWTYSIGSLPSQGLYFLSYNWAKDKLQAIEDQRLREKSLKPTGIQAMWVSFVAGAFADFAANFFVVPLEVIVQRIQIQDQNAKNKYSGGIDAVKQIYAQEGVRGFFRGFGATLLAYAPASAVWWSVYERCKALFSEYLFTERTGDRIVVDQHVVAQVMAGAVGGWATVIVTNPMDVVKTRLQTQHHQIGFEGNKNMTLYKNSFSAILQIYKEEGIRAFGKGIGPRMIATTFFSSWFGLIYETLLHVCKK